MKNSIFVKFAAGAGALLVFSFLAPRAIAQMDQDPVSSSSTTITYGSSFTPSYSGGDGGGGWQFMVSGYTSWTDAETPDSGTEYSSTWHSSWTPTSAGSYSFWVARDGDWEYNPSDIAGAYTLTVNKASQATVTVSASPTSISYGGTSTLSGSGGSGTGTYVYAIQSGPGTVSGATVTATGVGTIVASAYRATDTNYLQSGTATVSITVSAASQASVSLSASPTSISYGGTSTLSASGGSGTGAYVYAIQSGPGSVSGTTVTATGVGTIVASMYRASDSDYLQSSTATTSITASAASQASVSLSASPSSISYGGTTTLSASGGSGTGAYVYAVQSGPGSISGAVVTATGVGTIVASAYKASSSDYLQSGTTTVNITASKASQASVSSAAATINFDGSTQTYPSFTPSESGGSGTGGWQFYVSSYTSWDGGSSGATGTEIGTTWYSTWTPSGPDSYSFYVVRDGDSNYNASSSAGPYTLTVNGPVNGIEWNSIGLPTSGIANDLITFTASVTNNGSSIWGGSYELELKDQWGVVQYDASISGSGVDPGDSATPTFYLTLPSTPGTYTYTFTAEQPSVEYFGGAQTQSITVNPAPPGITSSTTAVGTYNTAFSYQIAATGSPTSYGASGLPSFLSIDTSTGIISGTPTATGTWTPTISATNSGGTVTATLNIIINALSATFAASPTTFTYDGSAHGPTITATPSGTTYSTTEASETSVGSYSLGITATGYYSGSNSISWSIVQVSQPTALAVTSVSTSFVQLVWTASTSTNGGIYYKIYRDGTQVGTSTTAGFVDLSLTPGSSPSYYIVAYDSAGSFSTNSTTVTTTVLTGSNYEALLGFTSSTETNTGSPLNFQILQPLQ